MKINDNVNTSAINDVLYKLMPDVPTLNKISDSFYDMTGFKLR